MEDVIQLNDISDELLILNKYTIEKLYSLDNSSDCIALYIFYYKTAKWQKTNIIKATDNYVKKVLKWGNDKIRRIKNILKENGLIKVVQRREQNKIIGWYIEVCYLVNQQKSEDIKIKVENIDSKNTYFQELLKATSRFQETNALKEYINYLKINNINAYNEVAEIFEKKEPKKKNVQYYGEYKNVFFTEEQYEKLLKDFPNDYKTRIQRLDDYIQSKGAKYKDCLAAIRNWARKEGYKFPKDEPKQETSTYRAYEGIDNLTSEEYTKLLNGEITVQELIKEGKLYYV